MMNMRMMVVLMQIASVQMVLDGKTRGRDQNAEVQETDAVEDPIERVGELTTLLLLVVEVVVIVVVAVV